MTDSETESIFDTADSVQQLMSILVGARRTLVEGGVSDQCADVIVTMFAQAFMTGGVR